MAFSGANMFALLDDEDGPKPVARAPAQAAAKPAAAKPARQADKSGACSTPLPHRRDRPRSNFSIGPLAATRTRDPMRDERNAGTREARRITSNPRWSPKPW